METSREVSHIHEVVVDAPFLDESTLRSGDKVVHERAKAGRQHLGDDFSNSMNEANGAEVPDFFRPILLWYEHNVGRVEPVKVCRLEATKLVDDSHYIHFDNLPTFLEEASCETIRSLGLVTWHKINGRFDLVFGDVVVNASEVNHP